MDIKITDLSLAFEVHGTPLFPVCDNVVFAVDTRGDNTERVVKAGIDLPSWINNPRSKCLQLTYEYDMQNVECTFKQSRSVLTFYGIRRDDNRIIAIFDLLGVQPVGTPVAMYRAVLVLNVGVRWDRYVVADIVTNDPEISQIAAVSETTSTLCSKSLFSVSVCTEHYEHVKITLRHDDYDEQKTIVTMSKLPYKDASIYVSDVVVRIFEIYKNLPGSVAIIPLQSQKTSGITHLRNMLPELFVNNYTRECPILPIMLSEEQAEQADKRGQRVIFYPVNSPAGRFYTAPDGYFVGLKKNRLENRHTFFYLVTCYLNDHMLRIKSTTYAYYAGQDKISNFLPSKRIPRFISKPGYSRRRASSFVNAIETATGIVIDDIPWCPNIVKQDMWDASDADIMGAIRSKKCGPSAYRYFEELLRVSIHVIEINSAVSDFFASKTRDYIWAAPYNRHIIIFETAKSTYGKAHLLYDFIVDENNLSLLNDKDPVVLSVLLRKNEIFDPPHDIPDVAEQLIDERGKCRIVITNESNYIITLTRPYAVPIMQSSACFFDEHITKMNQIKNDIGLPTTGLYKRSTVHTLYFPNDSSFEYWRDHVCQQEVRHT